MLESAPSSPRIGSSLSPKENTETNNFQMMSKGLSTSLPDLDSEPWIEVKKRHRTSTVKVKVKKKKKAKHFQVLYYKARFFTS